MLRILRGTAGNITAEFRDASGSLVDPVPPTPPVSVTDSSGTVVSTGSGAKAGTGVYTYAVTPTVTALMDTYTATWTPTIAGLVNTYTTTFEVCGGFFFSLTEARQWQNGVLANTATFTDAMLMEKRSVVEELFERACWRAFVPRGMRATLDGTGSTWLELPRTRVRKIISITADTVPYTAGDLATVVFDPESGFLRRTSGNWSAINPSNISVYFEYGDPQPPEPIKEAALEYVRHLAMPNNEDDRILSIGNEMGGTTRLSTPSLRFPTGFPKIDATLARYSDRLLHVG